MNNFILHLRGYWFTPPLLLMVKLMFVPFHLFRFIAPISATVHETSSVII